MDKYQFWDSNGLLNSNPNEKFGENSFLYAFEYGLIENLINKASSPVLYCEDALRSMDKGYGIYLQHPTNYEPMSHDQLTAIFGTLYIQNNKERMNQILNLILKAKFRYDGSWLHPRDFIFYSFLAGKWYGYFLFPLLIPMFLVAMFSKRERTNGKILWFVRGMIIKNRLWKKFYYRLINLLLFPMYGKEAIFEVFKIYFPDYIGVADLSTDYSGVTEIYKRYTHPIITLMSILSNRGIDG